MTDEIERQIEALDEIIREAKEVRKKLVKLIRKEQLSPKMLEVLEVVQRHPGIHRHVILTVVSFDGENHYNNTMTALTRHKRVVNRGTRHNPSYYAIERSV